MSAKLVNAFKFIIKMQGRDMTIERYGSSTITETVKMAPSNYFRKLAMVEEVVVEGLEFVVSKDALDAVSFPTPERGDTIVDSATGTHGIVEVKEMTILGQLVGFRLRTG